MPSNVGVQHIMCLHSLEGHTLNSLLGRTKVCGGEIWKFANKSYCVL